MTEKKTKQAKKKPPVEAIESVQMSLFSNFVSNDQDKVSNTIEMWEKIPKYFFTHKQIETLREESGLAQP